MRGLDTFHLLDAGECAKLTSHHGAMRRCCMVVSTHDGKLARFSLCDLV